jgi:general secretion pathway protein G
MTRVEKSAFTLVEILIVVVILGILAAIVVPQFTDATTRTAQTATLDQLNKVRRGIGVFQARNRNALPTVTEGDGTWGQIVGSGDYFLGPPVNAWVGGANARRIVFGTGPDAAFQTDHGWIYNQTNGDIWAGSFDDQDQPLPR